MRMIWGLVLVGALSLPGAAWAGMGSITEDNVGVVKSPDVEALEVVRLGYKHEVQVGTVEGAWVQIRVTVTKGVETIPIQGWMQGRFVRMSNGSLASTEVVEEAFGNDVQPEWGAGGREDEQWTEQAEADTIEWPVMTPDESKANDNWLSFENEPEEEEDAAFGDESTESFFETEEPDPIEEDSGGGPSWFD